MDPRKPPAVTEQLIRRVRAEFIEMPGLRLTARQARRLWDLDETTCAAVLNRLVEARFLHRVGPDAFGRVSSGPVARPRALPVGLHGRAPAPAIRKAG